MPLDLDSPDTDTEDAFFERGIAEERATLEALTRRPAEQKGRAPRSRRPAIALGVLFVGIGTFAVLEGARPRARTHTAILPESLSRPERRLVAGASPPEPSWPSPVTDSTEQGLLATGTASRAPEATERSSTLEGSSPKPAELAADACRAAVTAKRFREMLAVCEAAMSSERERASLALQVARIELERGRSASALVWARRTVKADSRLAEPYVIIGSVEQESGRPNAAREAYARYLALAPTGRYASDLRAIMHQH
jgi:hypothetical protein